MFKKIWIHAENVTSICLELHVAVRQFDPKQSLTMYAVLFWKSIVSLYQCVVYVMECPLQHETTFHCKERNTYWKNKPFNSRVPCGILWKICGIPACKIFLQKGHTFLWESFSWFWNITLRCAQHSFRKRVSCLPCIFVKSSIPFL